MKANIQEVYDSSIKFLQPVSRETTYRMVAQEAMRIVKGSVASIFILEDGKLRRVYSTHVRLYQIEPRKNGYTYTTFKSGKHLILNSKKIKKIHPEIGSLDIKYDIIIPLINKDKPFGILSVLSKKRRFNDRDIDTLKLLTPLASLAIRKAQLYQDLEKALKTRDLFLSMASHELKTPVTTAYTYLQLLKRKAKKGEKPDLKWIDNLMYEMIRLTKLINELLQLNQIKTGDFKYDFEEINILRVIDRAILSFNATHKKTELIFDNKTGVRRISLVGDFNKLIQVITNLLDNSVKHNVENRPIYLILESRGKNVQISVKDQGTGIKGEDLPNIFEEYYKGEGHTKAGLGLGLYLIRRIIDKHNGKITVYSKLGAGTTVKVKLPIVSYERTTTSGSK